MRTSLVWTRPIFAAALVIALVGEGRAEQDPPPTREELEQRIQELEDAVKNLRKDTRQLEVKGEEAARNKPAVEWKDGFRVTTPEGDFQLRADGYAHVDGRFFLDEESGARSQFLLRRARIDIRATAFKFIDMRIMPDFAGSQVSLQDAFMVARFMPELNFWAGKFKTPFGIERLQSALSLLFMERALPNDIVPNRDIGAMFQGFFFNSALQYQLGVLNGVRDGGSGDFNTEDDFDFAGRVFGTPFKDTEWEPLRGLGIGISGTYGKRRGSLTNTGLAPYLTPLGQQEFFAYNVSSPATTDGTAIATGHLSRVSPQAYWYWGPFESMAEYVESSTEITQGPTVGNVDNEAWQIRFGYVLTGEDAAYTGVVPKENFNPLGGTWGAWQVAARYDGLKIGHDAFRLGFANLARSASKAQEYAFALNWIWNRAVMVSLDYGHTWFDGGAANGAHREPEDVLSTRVQFFY